jgi:hypothetical protein
MNKVVLPARQATQPGGIGSLESILGLLKSLKIRALLCSEKCNGFTMVVDYDIGTGRG